MSLQRTVAGAFIGAAVVLAGTPAAAHHSVEATVDLSTRLQADMVLTRIDWINPHAWFHFSMTKPDGTIVQEVLIEWLGLSALRRAGISGPEAFKVGQTYKITYNPNRDGSVGGEIVTLADEAGQVLGPDGGGQGPGPAVVPVGASPALTPLTNVRY